MPRTVSLLALALLALVLPASAGAAGPIKPTWRGVQVVGIGGQPGPAEFAADLDQARALGSTIVRTDLNWSALEPREGQYDASVLANADAFFAAAHARNIKVMLVIVGTPCWNTTAPAPADACATDADRAEAGRYQPRDLGAFARVASMVAGRYSADLKAIEVWNEPDQANQLYWAGPDKVARYAELLKQAYPAIKQASPSTIVLGGALVGGNGAFLEALYKAGIKGSYDALSVHFYDLAVYQLGTIRRMRAKYGDKAPLWLGEFGFTSCLRGKVKTQLGGHACVTRTLQARHTLDVLRAVRRQRDVQGAVLFTLRDNFTYDFGLVDRAGRGKPVFKSVAAAYRGRFGKSRKVTLRLRARGGRLVAAGSGPVGDVYRLDVSVRGTLRYRAAFRLNRYGTYAIKLPGQLGRRGLKVSVRQYTVGGRPAVATLR
jgi:hypothetical protein